MATCSSCPSPSVIHMAYSGRDLCSGHFRDIMKRRVSKEVRLQGRIPQGAVVVLAVSGGKDSAAMLYLMKRLLEPRRDVSLSALLVDEGIEGYRPETMAKARELCEGAGVPLTVVSFADRFGATLDLLWGRWKDQGGPEGGEKNGGDGVIEENDEGGGEYGGEDPPGDAPPRSDLSPCGICGVLRRRCLNDGAKELGADVLVTGHNLDDMAQSVAMNLFSSELHRLVRLGPHPPERVLPGLVPRRMPLRMTPEKETFLYSVLEGLPFDDAVCPYADTATRGRYRDIIDSLEADVPGTRHRLLRTGDQLREMVQASGGPAGMHACENCGEPSSGELCQVCGMLRRLGL